MMMKSGCENASPRYRQRFRGYSVLVLSTTALVLCILTLGVGKVSAQEKSVRDGVYTEAQADRGAKLYGESCTGCHETGRFVGEQMKPWANQSARRLFNVVRLTMPEEDPGSLTRQQCADILAYIFRLNGFKAGSDELKGTDEAVSAVRIEEF